MLAKKLSMTLKLDGVPRYFMKKVPRYRYSVPSTDGTGNGTKKVPRYLCTRYCPPLKIKNKCYEIVKAIWFEKSKQNEEQYNLSVLQS